MNAEAKKPQLVKQWADWSWLRHAQERYEIVRGDRSLSQAFEAKNDQAAHGIVCYCEAVGKARLLTI